MISNNIERSTTISLLKKKIENRRVNLFKNQKIKSHTKMISDYDEVTNGKFHIVSLIQLHENMQYYIFIQSYNFTRRKKDTSSIGDTIPY